MAVDRRSLLRVFFSIINTRARAVTFTRVRARRHILTENVRERRHSLFLLFFLFFRPPETGTAAARCAKPQCARLKLKTKIVIGVCVCAGAGFASGTTAPQKYTREYYAGDLYIRDIIIIIIISIPAVIRVFFPPPVFIEKPPSGNAHNID